MLMKGRLVEIIRGLRQRVTEGWKGSEKRNSSACKKTRLDSDEGSS